MDSITEQNELHVKLKRLRVTHGYTQQRIAAFLDVDKTTYAHYEAGRRIPNAEKLRKLAVFYGLSDEMLGVKFPVEVTVKYPKAVLDRAEKCLQNIINVEGKNSDQLSKSLDMLWNVFEPIFKIRQDAFKMPEIPDGFMLPKQSMTIKKVFLDVRAENLINNYLLAYKKILHAMTKEKKPSKERKG